MDNCCLIVGSNQSKTISTTYPYILTIIVQTHFPWGQGFFCVSVSHEIQLEICLLCEALVLSVIIFLCHDKYVKEFLYIKPLIIWLREHNLRNTNVMNLSIPRVASVWRSPCDVHGQSSRCVASHPGAWCPCCGSSPGPTHRRRRHATRRIALLLVVIGSFTQWSGRGCFSWLYQMAAVISEWLVIVTHLEDLIHVESDVIVGQGLVQLLGTEIKG